MPSNLRHPPDQADRRRILADLSTCLMVEAAAGTGKTTCLVGRMIALLREGACDIEHLAAVTFTRKAAAELRARFQLQLERDVSTTTGPAKARLAEALQRSHRGFIGTIHAFCAKLLRERPIEAGVDLTFRELEDAEDDLLRGEAWTEYVEDLNSNGDGLLEELSELGLHIEQLRRGFLSFSRHPDIDAWPTGETDLGDLQAPLQTLREYLAHMESLLPTFPIDRGTDTLMNAYERIVRLYRNRQPERPADLMELMEAFKPGQKTTQKCWPGGAKQGKAESRRWCDFVAEVAQPLVARWRQKRYAVVLRALAGAVAVYDDLRRRGGTLNYQDLLLQAARLLRDKPVVRAYFRKRFTHLLVDEFQDTDPVQAELMLLITASDPDEREWRRCHPVPGALFVVGDPKQSIYRFRRADIVTYNQVKALLQTAGGAVLQLTTNFRTQSEILTWNNAIFDDRFPATADSYSPGASAMQVGRAVGTQGELENIHVLDIPAEVCGKEVALEYEASFIARYIRRCLNEGRTVPRSANEVAAGKSPQAVPGDFLVVTWNTKPLGIYARKLQELGIPCQVGGGGGFDEVTELRLWVQIVRALIEPENPVALVAVLRGELFGFSDADLYRLRRAGGSFSYRSRLPDLEPELADRLAAAWARLHKYASWMALLPVVAAVERIAGDLGLPQRTLLEPGGNVRAGSFAQAFQLLRQAQTEMHSLADVAVFLEDLLQQQSKQDGVAARPQTESAVRLLNLHKVKGLEAPVVFLAGPFGKWQPPIDLHIDRAGDRVNGYLAIHEASGGFHPKLLACPASWEAYQLEEQRFIDAERIRLLYVASTRVGCHLVVTRKQKDNAKTSYWDFFSSYLDEHPPLPDPGMPRMPIRQSARLTDARVLASQAEIEARQGRCAAATYASAAAKEIALTPSGLHRAAGSGEHGTEWGTVIHFLLQQAMLAPGIDLEPAAVAALEEQGLPTDRAEEALATVAGVRSSALWQRACAGLRVLVEVPFSRFLAPPEEGVTLPTVLRGVIDLAFAEPDGWVIVDYKTDAVTPARSAELIDHYRPQVLSYARNWEFLVGEPVKERGLYFVRTGTYQAV